jgi:hypothetical protein
MMTVLISLVALSALAAAEDGPISRSLAEVRAAFEKRKVLLSRYRITYVQSGFRRGDKQTAGTTRCVLLSEGANFRFAEDAKPGLLDAAGFALAPQSSVNSTVSTFDGGQFRTVAEHSGTGFGSFQSSASESAFFMAHVFGESLKLIAQSLDDPHANTYFSHSEEDGKQLLRFHRELGDLQELALLSPDCEWMPVRAVTSIRQATVNANVVGPATIIEREFFDYSDFGGVWLPRKSVHVGIQESVIPGGARNRAHDWTIEIQSVEIDPPRTEGEFRLVFPEGLVVTDRDSERRYTVGRNEKLIPFEGSAEEVAVSPAVTAARWTWTYRIAAGVCLIAVVVLFLIRRRINRE